MVTLLVQLLEHSEKMDKIKEESVKNYTTDF